LSYELKGKSQKVAVAERSRSKSGEGKIKDERIRELRF
jgi:hypothetical protein